MATFSVLAKLREDYKGPIANVALKGVRYHGTSYKRDEKYCIFIPQLDKEFSFEDIKEAQTVFEIKQFPNF